MEKTRGRSDFSVSRSIHLLFFFFADFWTQVGFTKEFHLNEVYLNGNSFVKPVGYAKWALQVASLFSFGEKKGAGVVTSSRGIRWSSKVAENEGMDFSESAKKLRKNAGIFFFSEPNFFVHHFLTQK